MIFIQNNTLNFSFMEIWYRPYWCLSGQSTFSIQIDTSVKVNHFSSAMMSINISQCPTDLMKWENWCASSMNNHIMITCQWNLTSFCCQVSIFTQKLTIRGPFDRTSNSQIQQTLIYTRLGVLETWNYWACRLITSEVI